MKDLYDFSHRLFYYEPLTLDDLTEDELRKQEIEPREMPACYQVYGSLFQFKRLSFGSKWISLQVEERIRDKKNVERVDLLRWLDGVGKGGVLYGWLFEQYVHETFQQGESFQLVSLQDDGRKELILNPQVGHYDKFTTTDSLENIFRDVYMTPNANNFESLDSFYYSEADKTLHVFQITRSAVHNVKEYGLIKLLELIKLKDETLNGNIELNLVFVIPQGLGDSFGKQRIVFDDIPSIEDLSEYRVEQVKGIGSAKRYKRLRDEAGITTGKQLYEAVKADAPEISHVRNVGKEFVQKVDARSSWDFLNNIPQFYIEFEVTNKK